MVERGARCQPLALQAIGALFGDDGPIWKSANGGRERTIPLSHCYPPAPALTGAATARASANSFSMSIASKHIRDVLLSDSTARRPNQCSARRYRRKTHSRHSTCKIMNLHASNTILDIPISAKHPQVHGPRSVFLGPVFSGKRFILNERPAKRMSNEFDSLDAREKGAVERALHRCRTLAARIESELRNNRPEHFVDEFSLADLYASLERAADVLRQKSRRAVNNTPAPTVKGSQARGRQRHR
jgi:hypothetical protein